MQKQKNTSRPKYTQCEIGHAATYTSRSPQRGILAANPADSIFAF